MPKGVVVGLRDLYYAKLATDVAPTPSYEAPVRIAGAISAKVSTGGSSDTLFADDGPYETATALGKITLEMNTADLPLTVQAALLGHTIAGGVLVRKSTDVPPWVAIGYRTIKSNGSYRYTWLAKGKFDIPDQENETKGDSVKFNTPTIKGSFVKCDADDVWERHTDEDEVDYMPSTGANWFNSPLALAADTVKPLVNNVVPADAATAIAVGASIVWTMSEALAASTVTKGSVLLFKDVDGSAVDGSLALNADRTQITFTPSAPLAAATAYRAVLTTTITDLAGNALATNSVTKFTTA